MSNEIRTAVFDDKLQIEAYRFKGVMQPFPNHFHECFVIGLIERGERKMICRSREYTLNEGDMLLLEPETPHGCVQTAGTLDYRALNISSRVMSGLYREITCKEEPLRFSRNVIRDSEISAQFAGLHEMIMNGSGGLEKEEALLFVVSEIIRASGTSFLERFSRDTSQIERACRFMEENFSERITLDCLCECCGMSKSTLLRSFTRVCGITPYRYLQTIRINKAKELIEHGVKPIDAALQTGFSDQSHFTNAFGTFIGLPPTAYKRGFGKDNKND